MTVARVSGRPGSPRARGVLLLGLLFLAACGGAKLPDVSGTWLDGSPFRTSDLKGRTVWLEFWAPWDAASLQRLGDLALVHQRHPDWKGRLVLVAASTTGAEVRQALGRLTGRPLPVILDGGPLGQALGVEMVPATVWVGPEGHYRVLRQGYVEPARLMEELAPLMGAVAP